MYLLQKSIFLRRDFIVTLALLEDRTVEAIVDQSFDMGDCSAYDFGVIS